jgi:ABC-type glycerol-3-phosphate transport system permease component
MASEALVHIRRRRRWLRGAGNVLAEAVLGVGAILLLVPLVWMLSTALKSSAFVMVFPPQWIPHPLTLVPFAQAWQTMNFLRSLLNTLFLAMANVVGVELTASMAAFAFARLRFPGRNLIFMVILSTLMLPGTVLLIPQFVMFKDLGWLNTYLPLIVPAFCGGGAFNIFLMRQFFTATSREIFDAARVDGCGYWGMYWRIMLPSAVSPMLIVFVFTFVGTWNDFLNPLIYLNNPNMYTLTLQLQNFVGRHVVAWNDLMAGTLMVAIVPIALFFIAQRYFTQGVVFTGIR